VIALFVASSLVVAQGEPARPPVPPQAVQEQFARFLWSEFREGRERLKRGVYHARGTKLVERPATDPVTYDVEIFGAFDFEAGLRRFDRSETPMGSGGRPKREETKPGVVSQNGVIAKWIMTPTKNIRWEDTPGLQSVAISAPGLLQGTQLAPFDVRCLGLTNWNNYSRGDLELDEILRTWTEMKIVEVVAGPGGLHRFTGTHGPDQGAKRTVWLDESKGFAPIRMEVYTKVPRGNGAFEVEPMFASALTWAEISGAWIPKTYHNERNVGGGKIRDIYDLVLDWESVNQEVPSKYFTTEGMDLKKGMHVYETRLNRSYVAEIIGEDYTPSPPPQPRTVKPARPRLSWYGVGATAAALLLAAAAVYWRRGRLAA